MIPAAELAGKRPTSSLGKDIPLGSKQVENPEKGLDEVLRRANCIAALPVASGQRAMLLVTLATAKITYTRVASTEIIAYSLPPSVVPWDASLILGPVRVRSFRCFGYPFIDPGHACRGFMGWVAWSTSCGIHPMAQTLSDKAQPGLLSDFLAAVREAGWNSNEAGETHLSPSPLVCFQEEESAKVLHHIRELSRVTFLQRPEATVSKVRKQGCSVTRLWKHGLNCRMALRRTWADLCS